MKKLISILVPAYNEEESLPRLYEALNQVFTSSVGGYDYEILFVNDGSRDKTLEVIRELRSRDKRVAYIDLSRNFGKENAMLAGFDYVRGDAVVIMDADMQDPPSLIPQLIREWENGYQDVYAKRRDRGKESYLRKQFSLLFYKILDHSTRFDILQNVGDFRLLDRQCINALRHLRETERYTKGMFCWIGYKKKEVVFDRGDREVGESKWNFWSLFNLAIEGITSFTTAPLRFASVVGVIIAILAFGAGIFYLVKTLVFGDPVRGFTTLIVFFSFLSGLQLLAIGILGEYLRRVFNEVKHRPVYLVREYNDEKVDEYGSR